MSDPIKILRPKSSNPKFTPMAIEFAIHEETSVGWFCTPTSLPGMGPLWISRSSWDEVRSSTDSIPDSVGDQP